MDSEGEYWRAYVFIENTVSYDLIDNPEILYEGGLAFGRFQSMLADYPAKTLHETIPDFMIPEKDLRHSKRQWKRMCAAEWIWSGRKFSLYWTGKKLWTAFRIC